MPRLALPGFSDKLHTKMLTRAALVALVRRTYGRIFEYEVVEDAECTHSHPTSRARPDCSFAKSASPEAQRTAFCALTAVSCEQVDAESK